MQATHECFCGNKLMKKVVKSDGECTHSCKGDKSQACGGSWRLAVYENPAFKHSKFVLMGAVLYYVVMAFESHFPLHIIRVYIYTTSTYSMY